MQKYLPVLRNCPFFGGLTDDEIFHILQEFEEEEEQIRQIVEAANEQGGRDNMGVILITPDI